MDTMETMIIDETLYTLTMEEQMVRELVRKIDPYDQGGVHRFTSLHDHERELLSEYVLNTDTHDSNAHDAYHDCDYDLIALAKSANKILGPIGLKQ